MQDGGRGQALVLVDDGVGSQPCRCVPCVLRVLRLGKVCLLWAWWLFKVGFPSTLG